MNPELSTNAQAILLLTAPLLAGRDKSSVQPLTASEYRQLARRLRELQREPADLLKSDSSEILKECRTVPDSNRLDRLLGRGFLLSQAIERWRTRAIWVLSRADAGYPQRFKKRLGEDAPPILYGCGKASILNSGGLAVVGSRNTTEPLIEYTEGVGRLVAESQRTLVSGGARGIDQAAMRGALAAGGCVAGVLGDSLERAVVRREYRDALMGGRLVLTCPYDPSARFQVGHAMQRNKLIYALAEAALVVNSDYKKGGTWTGAVEQLDKLKFVPIYVRSDGESGKGLDGLRKLGALPWPHPTTPESLEECLNAHALPKSGGPPQISLPSGDGNESASPMDVPPGQTSEAAAASATTQATDHARAHSAADELFTKVKILLSDMEGSRTEAGVAEYLQVSRAQAGVWLKRFIAEEVRDLFQRAEGFKTEAEVAEELRFSTGKVRGPLKQLVEERAIEKRSRPARYRCAGSIGPLFDR